MLALYRFALIVFAFFVLFYPKLHFIFTLWIFDLLLVARWFVHSKFHTRKRDVRSLSSIVVPFIGWDNNRNKENNIIAKWSRERENGRVEQANDELAIWWYLKLHFSGVRRWSAVIFRLFSLLYLFLTLFIRRRSNKKFIEFVDAVETKTNKKIERNHHC